MKELTSEILDLMRGNPNYWGRSGISQHYKLSEDLIREFHDKVEWYYISLYQELSEELISEFQDRVEWYWISLFQKLSEEFLVEFVDKIDLVGLEKNKNVSEDVFERIELLKGIL